LRLDFVGNLDGDLTFAPTYFEDLLSYFRQHPRLGIGGGWIYELSNGEFKPRRYNAFDAVPHAVQLVRSECYDDIGDYVPLPYGGADTCAGISAEMHGWLVRTFPELPVHHHRRTSSAGRLTRNYIRQGLMEHSLGYHPMFQFLRCVARADERPYLVRSALRFFGFWSATLRREPRLVSEDFVAFLRRRQLNKIRCSIGLQAR
jgi:hypothetical protein